MGKLQNPDIKLNNDGLLTIAVGRSRREVKWKNIDIKWAELINKLSNTTYTRESVEEYRCLSKEEQGNIKDVGGFVGGALTGEKRSNKTIANRTIITLDADYGNKGLWDIIEMLFDFSCCIYSTHKHTTDKPRLRLLIPLKRNVTPEEYQAVARMVAGDIGIEYFDSTTFEASRMMYWPSTSRDGVYQFNYQDGEWLNPDEFLNRYENWKDITSWPKGQKEIEKKKEALEKQEKSHKRDGIIGSFCSIYKVPGAIEKFLRDVYIKVGDNRYTYSKGTTSGGLVIYDDGNFAYSYHDTDPAGGKLLSSFDLVRIHKFGDLDEGIGEDTPKSKHPSFRSMLDLCRNDENVITKFGGKRLKSAGEEFDIEDAGEDAEWFNLLEIDKKGSIKPTIANIVIILRNDPYLKEKIALNEFSHRTMIRKSLPWRENINKEGEPWQDSDDAALRHYVERVYGIVSPNKISDAVLIIEEENKYHPIREYLEGVVWDGKKRVESLFIDYLGAENNSYTRKVTRKTMAAAAARVFEPGIKFDYMLVLSGRQGIGKSHILNLLGQNWYSDSLNTVMGKEAYEQLQEGWIIEMAELSAAKRAEVETIKHFISKREDIYRVAYGKRVSKFPRQCILIGTTNDEEFLKDKTGNRRFWPVKVGINEAKKNIWKDLIKEEVDQIWAEALEIWKSGEKLFLDSEILEEAIKVQVEHTESNSKEGFIREYLEILLPEDWEDMDISSRRAFIHGTEFGSLRGIEKRNKVCAAEIWVELFDGDARQLNPAVSREINDILKKIEGWGPYENGRGRLRFGRIYGLQTAFIREENLSDE